MSGQTENVFVNAEFQIRRDTAKNWEKENPVLQAGEPALVVDENDKPKYLKIGDGKTTWKELARFNYSDQKYNPESENAQSGIAVAEAVQDKADKSAIDDMRFRSISANAFSWEIGSLHNGNNMVSSNRIRTDYVWLEAGSVIKSEGNLQLINCYDMDKQLISATTWSYKPIIVENTGYVRILLAFGDQRTITEDNKSALIDSATITMQFGDVSMNDVEEKFVVRKTFTADDFAYGTLTAKGLIEPNTSRVHTANYIYACEGDIIDFVPSKSSINSCYIMIALYNEDKTHYSNISWGYYPITIPRNGYIRIAIGDETYTKITEDFGVIASMVTHISYLKNKALGVEKSLSNVAAQLTDVSNSMKTYAGEYDYSAKVAEFVSLYQNTGKIDSFLYFTDPHLLCADSKGDYYNQLINYTEVLGEFYNRTPTTFVLCNGDWLEWDDTPENALYKLSIMTGQMKKLFGENYYPAFGNHDDNCQGDETNGDPTHNNSVMKNVMFPFQDAMYYRFEGQTGSFYVLNSGTDQSNAMTDYRWEQIDWLANDLKSADKPYSAISMHIIWNVVAAHTLADDITPFATNVNSVITAYNNRSSTTLNGKTYDFTNCTGRVCFMLGGHGHIDHIDTGNYAVPMILTTAMYYGTSPTFEMVLVDWENGTLNMVRVGDGRNGENRTVDISGTNAE